MALRPSSQALLGKLGQPSNFYKHLLMCLDTPRPSHDLDKIRARLMTIGADLGLDCATDSAGNVRLRKKATEGFEKVPGIIMQCHMDIVCSKTEDKVHDFHTDPIVGLIEDGYLTADRTTLGADDGVGVAAGLAILEEKDLQHGQLELLITADEETTMGGAENIDKAPFLTGSVLLNLDSEEEHAICVGCAGGFEKDLTLPIESKAADLTNNSVVFVKIHSFLGGHSGIDIHKQRANAIKLLARMIQEAKTTVPVVQLASFSGGNAKNAIPRDAKANIVVASTHVEALKTSLAKSFAVIKTEYATLEQKVIEAEEGKAAPLPEPAAMELVLQDGDTATVQNVASPASSAKLLALVSSVPSGVIRLSPDVEGTVDTSVNLGLVELNLTNESSTGILSFLGRSSVMLQTELLNDQLDNLALLAGAESSNTFGNFPGWEPDVKSDLVQTLVQTHEKLFQTTPKVYSVHAGLECGLLQGPYPDLVCASIGPQIDGAHSPDERLKLSSVQPWYNWLKSTISVLAQTPTTSN